MELLIIILVLAIFHYRRLKRIEAKLATVGKNANSHYVCRVSARLTIWCPSRKHRTLCNLADPEKRHPRCTPVNAGQPQTTLTTETSPGRLELACSLCEAAAT